jgi:DNA-binding transcriptional MerR regulator
MYTIGEFSRLGAISVRMLRHYDEIGLLTPAHVDPATGNRSYAIAQLRDLNRIVALRGLGFSLAEVRRLLAGITAAELRGMLQLRQAELEQRLAADRASRASSPSGSTCRATK